MLSQNRICLKAGEDFIVGVQVLNRLLSPIDADVKVPGGQVLVANEHHGKCFSHIHLLAWT